MFNKIMLNMDVGILFMLLSDDVVVVDKFVIDVLSNWVIYK